MTFSYYPPKTDKGEKYARLYPKNPIDDNLSCQIHFSELQFQKTDSHYILTGKIESHTNGIQKDFKEFVATGEIVIIRLLHKPEYETNYKGEKKTTKQSILEKYLCSRFDELDESKAYSGHIRFRYDGMLNYLLEGKLDGNMKLEQAAYAMTLTEVAKTIELEEVKTYSGSGKQGYTFKAEDVRLAEIMKFKLSQLSLLSGSEIPDFKAFMQVASEIPEIMEENLKWLDKLIK